MTVIRHGQSRSSAALRSCPMHHLVLMVVGTHYVIFSFLLAHEPEENKKHPPHREDGAHPFDRLVGVLGLLTGERASRPKAYISRVLQTGIYLEFVGRLVKHPSYDPSTLMDSRTGGNKWSRCKCHSIFFSQPARLVGVLGMSSGERASRPNANTTNEGCGPGPGISWMPRWGTDRSAHF